MTKRIFRSICLVAILVFLASLALIMGMMYTYYTGIQRDQLKAQTLLAAQAASHEGLEYFSGLEIPDCRITWIDTDGTVLYDSRTEIASMENHLERSEIRDALKYGYGESARYSATLTESYFYSAQRLPDGTVLRLSMAQISALNLILGMAQPICVGFAVALVLSMILAARLSRSIVDPLNRLDLDDPLSRDHYEELTPLLRRIDSQHRQLHAQALALNRKQNEFNALTSNMTEGLVLLNSSCVILTVNRAARNLLGLTHGSVGTDILTYSKELSDLLLSALDGKQAEKTMELQGGTYQVDASPVHTDGNVTGVVLLLFDITQKLRAEQLRREFTANVSHELKTPLHSISGYAELICHGIAAPEDIAPFSEKIYSESQRMIRLVEDIIRLSQLDEGIGDLQTETLDLQVKARQITAQLADYAASAQVSLNVVGEPTQLHTVPHLLTAIVMNLCDNAIKYNRPNGSVTLRVGKKDGCAFISVEDTGIGIPAEHQNRIFERFYRVDKSHSKQVGGTGLGLSIVKHAVQLLGGRIDLKSIADQGTTITVYLPQ